jgi:hypothetical protein
MRKLPDMTATMSVDTSDWVNQSSLVLRWKQMKEEVDRYKWLESEKAGHDIGWDRAWTQWMTNHQHVAPE